MRDSVTQLKDAILSIDSTLYYRKRTQRLQEYLELSGLDAAICMRPQNILYLSGFNPILFSHPMAVIVPREGHPILLTHCLRANHARHESVIKDLQLYGMWGKETAIANDFISALRKIFRIRHLKSRRIGYEGDFLPVNIYTQIIDALDVSESVNISPELIRVRMVKDPYERMLIRLAARLTEAGMEEARLHIMESEAHCSIAAENAMRRLWADQLSELEVCGLGNTEGGVISALWCYSNNGERTAFGCECPGPRIPQPSTTSVPSIWACIRGYYAEMERTEVIGSLASQHEKAYRTVLAARQVALNTARAGITAGELYAAAAQVYINNGFAGMLPGRIGHGLGLGIHEQPSLERNSSLILQEGMIVTIEPGLMFSDWGTIRNSDTVIIQNTGVEILTQDMAEQDAR